MRCYQCGLLLSITTLFRSIDKDCVKAFSIQTTRATRLSWILKKQSLTSLSGYPPRKGNNENTNEDDDFDPFLDDLRGRGGDDRNWIEKSSPIGIENEKDETDGNFDLGINGQSFQTGSLSKRMFDSLISLALKRFPPGTTSLPSELEDVYKVYTIDITAKEVIKAALEQNGLQLTSLSKGKESEQDLGEWGSIDSVQLYDTQIGELKNNDKEYDSIEAAVEGGWIPGQEFNFVVRNVPAKLKEMDISDVLNRLDPDGKYRAEAKEMGMTLPDEEIETLCELGKDSERRTTIVPRESETDETVFAGDESKGYNVIHRSELLKESCNMSGSEKNSTLMHVMDALVNHGCLLVDLSDGGTCYENAIKISKMWQTIGAFFKTINEEDRVIKSLPKMGKAEETGSPNAAVGFANYGSMQFLETRIKRDVEGISRLLPVEVGRIIEEDGVSCMTQSFDIISHVGKDVARIAVAAASIEYDAFSHNGDQEGDGDESDLPFISGLTFEEGEISIDQSNNDNKKSILEAEERAASSAALMFDDLIDDGTSRAANPDEGNVNMSPHRMCRYTGSSNKDSDDSKKSGTKETFGAHTDTTFITIVPVAEVSGLEVFDEAKDCWFRPELLARKKWEAEQEKRKLDPTSQTEKILTVNDDGEDVYVDIPWHSRYLAIMPGELLQICSRNEVPASVHRVVTVTDGASRLSAPVLLRARCGVRMDTSKYFGREDVMGPLLSSCDGMKMEEIHDALQPSSYRKKK